MTTKIAIISDTTFEPVLKQLRLQKDFEIDPYIYADQIVPELMQAGSRFEGTDILIIHFDSYFYRYPDEYISEILKQITNIAHHFSGTLLLSNNLTNGRSLSVLKTNSGQNGQAYIKHQESIQEILRSNNVYFYDVNKIISQIGLRNTYNFKLGFLYQMPYTKEFIQGLATELTSLIHFIGKPEKKMIVLDCDNTLWKGILGEDGLDGIRCDKNAGGVLFYQFQEFLLDKKKEGFILGLCSKNNEADVKEAFDQGNMPLKWADFIIKKVNWKNKSENLAEAASELNIGLDSFIFIDDNEFELQSVQLLMPEICTLKIGSDYQSFLDLIDHYALKRKRLTKEDLVKTDQYLAEQQRNQAKASVQSFAEYIQSLSIKMDISANNNADLARLSQLTEKTNQFNFNKEIFSVTELENFISAGNQIYGLRVSDKFGDYGLVGLILIEINRNKAKLRNFLMSCRALGRGIEDDFFRHVLQDLTGNGMELSEIQFRETAKNTPARTFYEGLKMPIH